MGESSVQATDGDGREVVLVTGASRGFGLGIVEALAAAGYRVVASMREPDERNARIAVALRADGIDVVELDVCRAASVEAGVAETLRLAGRVDVLVSNAGQGIWGPLEAATADELRAQLELAVIGPHALVRSLLPGMRERGRGLLVHVSSVAGRLAVPGFGAYCVAKWALEAMAEVFRYELVRFGIESVTIEPGGYATDFHHSSLQRLGAEPVPEYAFLRLAQEERRRRATYGEPAEVVDAVLRVIATTPGERPARVPVGTGLPEELATLNAVQERITHRLLESFRCTDLFPGAPERA